jgi:hypothetical protein
MANKARIISEEEFNELYPESESKPKYNARVISGQELEEYTRTKSPSELNDKATIGDYLRAVPATAVDITAGAAEGVASAIGEFTGDYDLARSISEARTDINDSIMGDAPDSVKSDFAYKLASGLGSTIPFLGAALVARKPSLIAKVGANGFFLASAGQQVRDDYLGTQGVTSETATDEQMSESNKVGAIGAIPIAMAEKLGAGVILGAFKGGAIPAGQVMQRISQYAAAGAGEAATEVAQSGIINSIASYVGKYDPDRPITQGMAESALIGFLVGGGVNAGIDTVERAITQGDRLQAGVKDGSINAKDVIDEDIGSKFAAIAMENDGVPEADGYREAQITDPKSMSNFISKTLTPLSQRLGRAGKEVVREFRKFELDTGLKLREFKNATAPFSKKMLELKKKSPEDYKILSQALANANELAAPLPNSVQKDLEQKAQLQPEVTRSTSEQLLDTTNANAQVINEQIGMARKALEGSGLKTRIQIVESGNSYYDPSTNTIAISASEADTTTVAHEYFHAVLGQAVKTDVELQSMTRNMFDSVIRATVSGSSINEQLKGFVSQYDSNVQNEEFLAQTVGELASQYETLDINTRTRIKVWINQVMQKLGVSGVFKEAETDAEVIDQLNAFARFSGKPEALTGRIGAVIQNENNGGSIISEPVRATKFVLKDLTMAPKVSFNKKPRKNSNINSGDSLDIVSLLNDAVANDKKVVFWQSDQLGIGTYTSKVNGKKYELDAGLGFAKSKVKGRDKFAWATGSEGIANQVAKADLVFMVSGDPETQHFFNENIFDIIYDNVEASQGSVDNFVENLSRSENTADITLADALRKIQDKFGSKEELKGSPVRKEFNLALSKRMLAKKGQGKTDDKLWSEMNKIFPFADEVRDGHLSDNGFGVRDVYAVFAPNGKTGVDEKMHSTYNVGVGGKFLGTPDRVVNAIDVLSNDYIAELYENPKNQTSKGPISEGQLGAKVVGAQATYAKYNGRDLKETTPQQVADAIARDKPVKLAKTKPATPEQIKSGAKAARKDQLDRSTASVNFRKWMGKGQLIHDDGEPMVLYHGTKGEFDEFTSKKNLDQDSSTPNWLYFATNPKLAENMAAQKTGYRDGKDADDKLQEYYEEFSEVDKSAGPREGDTATARGIREDGYVKERTGVLPLTFERNFALSIMPVYLNAKNIWNPTNSDHVSKLMAKLRKNKEWKDDYGYDQREIASGEFRYIENAITTKALSDLGFDGAMLMESKADGLSTVAIWNKNGVKSATGNNGEYSLKDNNIRRQKSRTASDEEMMQGLSNDGMRILQKYGMTEDYRGVRSVLDRIKGEYTDLGLDNNFIENYFPRLVQDLDGLKTSYGQKTGLVDQEIRRYEKTTGQSLSDIERQMMFEKLARSNMYRSGMSAPSNMKERITDFIKEPQMKYYADPEVALDNYIEKMVNAIETKKLIGDSASGKTQGADPVAGRLGEVMDKLASEGRLRDDQINVIRGAVAARFGSHGAQYGFVKGAKNMGYLATMGNVGSTLTQLGDFYFTMVQNGLIPTVEAALGRKDLTVEDLGIAKDMVEIDSKQGAGMFSKSVDTVFRLTGLTAMDRLAKNTNINATHKVLTKGAKSGQNTNSYKKTLARLKRVQGDDAYKTIADLKNGVKSEYVIEAIYNNLADVAPISLTEMPEAYAGNPNLRIMYSLKSYTIKQFNFVRERVWTKLMQGIATKNPKMIGEASTDMMKILAFSTLANGSSDVLKSIIFNREIDEDDFMWNTLLRIFGITKYTTVQARKEGLGTAALKTIAPPQFSMMSDVFKDAQEMERIQDMRSVKYVPFVGKLYYWAEGRGVETEEKLSRLREKPLYQKVTYPDPPRQK